MVPLHHPAFSTTNIEELPSDPKDPERKNEKMTTDIPMEKGELYLKELHKRPELNIPQWQTIGIH